MQLYFEGLEKPSAVHQRGIVPLCKGLDVIQQSLYGTTETLACGVLQRLDYGSSECQALVVVPTHDLAQETKKVIGALGQWLGVKAHACLGGTSVRDDKKILPSSIQVIVSTPGRVLDMLRRRALCPDNIRMFVLDEADEMLKGGLKDQVGFGSSCQLSCIVITKDDALQTSLDLIILVLFKLNSQYRSCLAHVILWLPLFLELMTIRLSCRSMILSSFSQAKSSLEYSLPPCPMKLSSSARSACMSL
jgi:hypothetical protein